MKRSLLTAAALTATIGMASATDAAIIYVDAQEGAAGNTVRTSDSDDTAWATQWTERTVFGNGGEIWQSQSSTVPEIETSDTVSSNTYDVWVFFWDATNGNDEWTIDAGLTSGSLTTYVIDNATKGAGQGVVDANTLTFTTAVLVDEGNRDLYGVNLGQVTGTEVSVFIGSSATNGDSRTWYDGIGYEVVPEPSSLALLGLGGLCMLKRRRRD